MSTPSKNNYSFGDADLRPWGRWEVVALGEGYIGKEICVSPGEILSLQSHKHRSEHWVILEGVADVTIGDQTQRCEAGQSVFIPQSAKHRIANPGQKLLRFFELQVGAVLDEGDITRYEDRYGR